MMDCTTRSIKTWNCMEMSEPCQDFIMPVCDVVSCMKRWLRSKSCVMEARDNGVAKVVSWFKHHSNILNKHLEQSWVMNMFDHVWTFTCLSHQTGCRLMQLALKILKWKVMKYHRIKFDNLKDWIQASWRCNSIQEVPSTEPSRIHWTSWYGLSGWGLTMRHE